MRRKPLRLPTDPPQQGRCGCCYALLKPRTSGRRKKSRKWLSLSTNWVKSLGVDDVDAAEEFYGQKLGLRKLYRFGDLVFFDYAGVRLFVEKSRSQPFVPNGSVLGDFCSRSP